MRLKKGFWETGLCPSSPGVISCRCKFFPQLAHSIDLSTCLWVKTIMAMRGRVGPRCAAVMLPHRCDNRDRQRDFGLIMEDIKGFTREEVKEIGISCRWVRGRTSSWMLSNHVPSFYYWWDVFPFPGFSAQSSSSTSCLCRPSGPITSAATSFAPSLTTRSTFFGWETEI